MFLMIEFTLISLSLLNEHLDVEVIETTGGVWESKREILCTGHLLAIADHYKRKSLVIFPDEMFTLASIINWSVSETLQH